MNRARYLALSIAATLLRFLPMPCRTGIIRIGNPGRDSPVFLTGNYCLTVERVKKALRGLDCYLVVANSRGINVWCASAGGHLTTHSVVSALKTSGIENLVDHRTVVLPQLAAAGVEARKVAEKAGWRVVWGPVYAEDIPRFVKNGFRKTPDMRETRFPAAQRLEMAIMWAFPFSAIAALLALPFSIGVALHLALLIWMLSLQAFLLFPLYSGWLPGRGGFDRFLMVLGALWALSLPLIAAYQYLANTVSPASIARWGAAALAILSVIVVDLGGSTPVHRSSLHGSLRVALDAEKCRGCGVCVDVCPRNCYDVDNELGRAVMARAGRCIRCGACIVQCPFDALSFETPEGAVIPPEMVRRYKLNMLGKRTVET